MVASQSSERRFMTKLEGGVKGRLTVVYEVVEEEGGKIEEWIEEDKMGQIGDASNEL